MDTLFGGDGICLMRQNIGTIVNKYYFLNMLLILQPLHI